MRRKAVFLDRDGVLNRALVRDGKPYPPRSLDELVIPPETAPALFRLKEAGFLLIVLTNQPDVARGAITRASVDALHDYMGQRLPVDEFRVCDHDDPDGCSCRKPKPGLILDAADDWNISLGESFMIGDRWRDVDAGAAAGCRTVLIDYEYRERGPSAPPSAIAKNLEQAVQWILEQDREEQEPESKAVLESADFGGY